MTTGKPIFSLLAYTLIFLSGALYAWQMSDLAIYFLAHEWAYRISGFLLIMVFLWGSYLFFNALRGWHRSILYVSIALIVTESLSFQVLNLIRPFSLYFSVILSLNLVLVLLLYGYVLSNLLREGTKGYVSPAQSFFLSIVIITLVQFIPIRDYLYIVPYILPLPIISLFTWTLIDKQVSFGKISFPLLTYIAVVSAMLYMNPIKTYDMQSEFEDKVIFSSESEKNDIVITQWMDEYWIYLNKLKNVSTIDEFLYYEPMIHAAASLAPKLDNVLILGGENGCGVRELLKHDNIREIILVPFDSALVNISISHPVLLTLNDKSLSNVKVKIENKDILSYITQTNSNFDLIIADLPDPRDVETNQFYTLEFYEIIKKLLDPEGIFITQAGSPYFSTRAYKSIGYTLEEAGIFTLPIHNQILTLGEWGWMIGSTTKTKESLKETLIHLSYEKIPTRWLNSEANTLLLSFGKDYLEFDTLQVNTVANPVLYGYYLEGTWDLN